MESSPVCLTNSSSESSSLAGLLSELSFYFGFVLVSSMSKIWTLVNNCCSRGNPELESCAI